MLSPKRCAQLGLGAAGVVLFGSVTVLLIGAADVPASVVHAADGSHLTGDRQIAVVSTDPITPGTLLAKR